MNNKLKGIIFLLISGLSFSVMNVFVHLSGDLPTVQKSFFRNIVALVVALVILLKEKEKISISKGSYKYLILRSAAGTIGLLCNYFAVDHLMLADASILSKLSPFFAILFSYLLLKENVKTFQIIAVLGAFIGSMFVVKPTFNIIDYYPALIALSGGVMAGLAYSLVRVLGKMGTTGAFVVFFFSGFSSLMLLPFFIIGFQPMSTQQIIYLLLAGITATGGQFGLTLAYFNAAAKDISVFDYSQILFSALLGFYIFDQIPDYLSFIGYLIIIAIAVIMFIYNRRK